MSEPKPSDGELKRACNLRVCLCTSDGINDYRTCENYFPTPTIPEHGMEGDAGREDARQVAAEIANLLTGPARIAGSPDDTVTIAYANRIALSAAFDAALYALDYHASRADRAEAALREAREALDAAHYYIDAHDNELAEAGITRSDALDIARDKRAALEPK